MIDWLKANSLKVASVAALGGDVFLGLAGGIGLVNLSFETPAYALLTVGGILGAFGHAALLFWGKGSKGGAAVLKTRPPSIMIKPFIPWHYPLDCGFFFFVLANFVYIVAGILVENYALSLGGVLAAVASLVGWLWPQGKPIMGLRSMQMTSLLYSTSTMSYFIAAILKSDPVIFMGACCFLACNVIFFTIRKENQSAYTQTHES